MENFEYCRPTRYVFGKGTEEQTGKLLKEYGYKKALIVYGGGSAVRTGLLGRVQDSLEHAGIEHIALGGVRPNPRADLVYAGIKMGRDEKVDVILPVGGGSVIDTAKAIGIGIPYSGDFFDFYTEKAVPQAGVPICTVLTIPAAGSEGSDRSVVEKEIDGVVCKNGTASPFIVPVFSILNPELTYTLPNYQTACGVVDMMAHIMERYFTNTQGVAVTDRMCEGILAAIVENALAVFADGKNYDARANLMWAGTLAHNNICGVGRVQDWASHHIEHTLSALYDVAHGAGLAVIFPAWMEYTLKHDVMRFAQFASRVFNCDMDFSDPERTAREGIQALRHFYKQLGMPLNFSDIGAREQDIPLLLNMLCGSDPEHLEGNFMKLRREDCEQILRLAAHYQS
ncbi:MAG: iron-containing alcohol dehydrogenase [Succinivibrio sp.]|nr:iron-containing alcohol dehydrogenase [Succinivibrio sp.]